MKPCPVAVRWDEYAKFTATFGQENMYTHITAVIH
jgi:hypothetical protein